MIAALAFACGFVGGVVASVIVLLVVSPTTDSRPVVRRGGDS